MASRQGTQILAVNDVSGKHVPVKVGGTIGRTEALGVTLVNTDPLLACVDTSNSRLKVDIEDVTGMGLATQATLADLDTRIANSINTGATTFGENTQLSNVIPRGRDVSAGQMRPLTVDGDGHLQIDVISSVAPTGVATEATLSDLDTRIANSINTGAASLGEAVSLLQVVSRGRDVSAGQMRPLTVDGDGHLQVDVISSVTPTGIATETTLAAAEAHLGTIDTTLTTIDGVLDNVLVDTSAIKTDVAALEVLQTSTNTKLDTVETTLTNIETDAAALEVLQTSTNSKLDTIDGVLDNILIDTSAIKTDAAALEVLQTSTNSKLDTIDGVLDNILIDSSAIKTDVAALEVLQTTTNTKLDTVETTLTAIETDAAALEVLQTSTNSKLDTIDGVLDNILIDTSAIKVDAAALEVLQTTTNSTISTMSAKLPSALDDDRLKVFTAKVWDTTTVFSEQATAAGATTTSSQIDLGVNGGGLLHFFVTAAHGSSIDAEITITGAHASGGTFFPSDEDPLAVQSASKRFSAADLPRYIKILIQNKAGSGDLTSTVVIGQFS